MTQKDDGSGYFFYMAEEDEKKMPKQIEIKSQQPASGAKVSLLGSKTRLKWKKKDNGFVVTIPESLRNNLPCNYVWTLKVSKLK